MDCHVCHARAAVDGGACDCCEAVRRIQRIVHSQALPPGTAMAAANLLFGVASVLALFADGPPRRSDSREPDRERSRTPEPSRRRREDEALEREYERHGRDPRLEEAIAIVLEAKGQSNKGRGRGKGKGPGKGHGSRRRG